MAGLNKCMIIGHLGKDPEIKTTQSGMAVANFSVAVSEKRKGEDATEWFRVVAFDKLADICGKYLTKGKQVYIEGRIQTREWEDRDGNKRQTTEIIANQMVMLGGKGDGGGGRDEAPQERPQAPAEKPYDPEDDIPF